MKKLFLLSILSFTINWGLEVRGDTYRRAQLTCRVSGTTEDIDTAPQPLPNKFDVRAKVWYVQETNHVVRQEVSLSIDPKITPALPKDFVSELTTGTGRLPLSRAPLSVMVDNGSIILTYHALDHTTVEEIIYRGGAFRGTGIFHREQALNPRFSAYQIAATLGALNLDERVNEDSIWRPHDRRWFTDLDTWTTYEDLDRHHQLMKVRTFHPYYFRPGVHSLQLSYPPEKSNGLSVHIYVSCRQEMLP